MNDEPTPYITRMRRILDEPPPLPARAADHEISPPGPTPEKSTGDKIADNAIAMLTEVASHVLEHIPPLRERLDQVEQMVIKALADGQENLRAQIRIMEAGMKVIQQIDQQIAEAVKPLEALGGMNERREGP